MLENELQAALDSLQSKITPQERLLCALEANLPRPLLYDSGLAHHGYRYGQPDGRHFCLLKAVRAVSALNACIQLARHGFAQEIGVLIRTIAECCSQIEFVLPEAPCEEKVRPEANRFVGEYFGDYRRNSASDFVRLSVQQRKVHEIVGAELDKFMQLDVGITPDRIPALTRLQAVYSVFSNYVHARYPEVMDMYGGVPGSFHPHGMKGTSKDDESVTIIEAFVETVSLALKAMVPRLNLFALIEADEVLREWYNSK